MSAYVFVGLKFLVRLCTDMNLKESQEYANKLKKAEKMQKLREEVITIVVAMLHVHLSFCPLALQCSRIVT